MPSDLMSADFDSDWNYDRNDPFYDLKLEQEFQASRQSFGEQIDFSLMRQVAETLGVETVSGSIAFEGGQFAPENLRGVRFNSVEQALVYLFDAGILQFSNAVITSQEVAIEVAPDSGRTRRKRNRRGGRRGRE